MAINIILRDILIVGGAVLAVLLALWFMNIQPPDVSHTTITVGDVLVSVEIAATDASRTQGLSGRKNLPEGEGMLFVFDAPGRYPFWMKEMNFPIDIIWLDADGVVISLVEDASPDSYPLQFTPDAPALYVLEVPIGFIKRYNLAIEEKVIIPPNMLQ